MNYPDIDILKKMFVDRVKDISTGKLAVSCSEESDSTAVWNMLKDFGGIGWVCHTDSPKVLIFPEKGTISEENGWILSAEAVNGNESLHISRDGAKWCVTRVKKQDAEDGMIVKDSFLCTDGGKLCYETSWQLLKSKCGDADITEYKPCAYRFVGFTA